MRQVLLVLLQKNANIFLKVNTFFSRKKYLVLARSQYVSTGLRQATIGWERLRFTTQHMVGSLLEAKLKSASHY